MKNNIGDTEGIDRKRLTCKNSQQGRIVIHSGNVEKRIYPEELDKYTQEGWIRGASSRHRENNSLSNTGRIPWNKGSKGKMPKNSTTWQKGHQPWNKGKTGVQQSWSKGLTKYTDSRVADLSDKLKAAWRDNEGRRDAQSERGKLNAGKHLTPEALQRFNERSCATRRNNNTFNTSSKETGVLKILEESYGRDNVKVQYRDKERYPFRCDFYIPSEDLFIELNLHWTHGGKPYNPDDPECIKQLELWQEKAKTSKFYQNAIETWTIRDVKKFEFAKKNNLNYVTIYTDKEI